MITLVIYLLLISVDCHRVGRHLLQHQCQLTPQSIDGPFYLDKNMIRQEIREYRPGIPFKLILHFNDANSCQPLQGLWIVIWQCDAIGYYSGYTKINPSVTYNSDHGTPTDNSTFLRGAQQTDQDGMVQFQTVLPGNIKLLFNLI